MTWDPQKNFRDAGNPRANFDVPQAEQPIPRLREDKRKPLRPLAPWTEDLSPRLSPAKRVKRALKRA